MKSINFIHVYCICYIRLIVLESLNAKDIFRILTRKLHIPSDICWIPISSNIFQTYIFKRHTVFSQFYYS